MLAHALIRGMVQVAALHHPLLAGERDGEHAAVALRPHQRPLPHLEPRAGTSPIQLNHYICLLVRQCLTTDGWR